MSIPNNDLLKLLPKRTAELADVIGLAAALKLVERHGGRHIWVPKNASANHWLTELVGMEALEKICAYYGYSQLEIDRCAALVRAIKNQTILAEFNAGLTNGQLALKYNTSERNIRLIKNKTGQTKPIANYDLFADLL